MIEKKDHLRLCNEYGVSFQDFEAQFCSRCVNPECTRSQAGKSRFEARVSSWEERLFLNVPRMDPSDERFQSITAKKFLTVMPSSPLEIRSDWIDPRTAAEPPAAPSPVVVAKLEPVPEPERASELVSELVAEPVPVAPASAPSPPPNSPGVMANTPNRPKQMIGGGEKPTQPVLDPWQPKPPAKPGEQSVKPGARIKFGG